MTTTQRRRTTPAIYLYPSHPGTPPSLPRPSLSPKKRGAPQTALTARRVLLVLLIILFFMPTLLYGVLQIWQTSHYQPIQAGTRIARVHAIANGTLNSMRVDLTLYKSNGSISYQHTYLLEGEKWMLRDEVIIYPSWTGLSSGYKIVQVAGYNTGNINLPLKDRDRGTLNGGEDSFYSFLKGNAWGTPFGKTADYKVYVKPGPRPLGTTYDIRLNADGSMYTQQLENHA